jgi:hypothetical protein
MPPVVAPFSFAFRHQPLGAASYRKINTVPTSNPLNDRCQSDSVIPLAIDFSAIEATLNEHATEIRKRANRVGRDIYEIGRRLTEAKKLLGHGNWYAWIEREFNWSEQTALNLMRCFEMFHRVAKSKTVLDLNINVSAMYLLARPSTPVEAQKQIIEQAATADTPVTTADVKKAIKRTETKQPQPSEPQPQPEEAKLTPTPAPPEPEAADDEATARRIAARCATGTIATALKALVCFATEKGRTEGRAEKFLRELLLTEPSYDAFDVLELIKWLKELHAAWKAHDRINEKDAKDDAVAAKPQQEAKPQADSPPCSTEQQVRVYLEDEAPRLGSGWRLVTAQIGRKWVRLRDAKGRTARFTIEQYAKLKPEIASTETSP